jgi:hypothetical protein
VYRVTRALCRSGHSSHPAAGSKREITLGVLPLHHSWSRCILCPHVVRGIFGAYSILISRRTRALYYAMASQHFSGNRVLGSDKPSTTRSRRSNPGASRWQATIIRVSTVLTPTPNGRYDRFVQRRISPHASASLHGFADARPVLLRRFARIAAARVARVQLSMARSTAAGPRISLAA